LAKRWMPAFAGMSGNGDPADDTCPDNHEIVVAPIEMRAGIRLRPNWLDRLAGTLALIIPAAIERRRRRDKRRRSGGRLR
jgi:hypothetical protein